MPELGVDTNDGKHEQGTNWMYKNENIAEKKARTTMRTNSEFRSADGVLFRVMP